MSQSWEQVQEEAYIQSIQRKVPGYRMLHDITAIQAAQSFPAEGRILIIGAGGGEDMCTLSKVLPDAKLIGIDSSPRMLEIAARRVKAQNTFSNIELIRAELNELPSGVKFDAAVCLLMFHFIPNEEKLSFLQELQNRLYPEAKVLLASLCSEETESAFELHLKVWEQYILRNGGNMMEVNRFKANLGHTTFLTNETRLQVLLRDTGFSTALRYFQSLFTKAWIIEKRGEIIAKG